MAAAAKTALTALVSALGSFAVEGLKYFGKKALTITSYIALALAILTLLPFDIAFPDFLMEIFRGDFLKKLLQSISYFFPVAFALKCLAVLFLSKYYGLIKDLLVKIYRIISGGLNGN